MDPRAAYESRQRHWQTEAARLQRLFLVIGNERVTVAIAAIAIAVLSFWRGWLSAWWLLAPLAAFVALIVWHERVVRRRDFAERAIRFCDRGVARLSDRWQGAGSAGESFRDTNHVYADDLDVFGKGSLFELISRARTGAGERTLARWLLAPAERTEALRRQQAIGELRERLDLREDLALLGEDVQAEVHADTLNEWGSAPPVMFSTLERIAALLLAAGSVLTFSLFMAQMLRAWPFVVMLACDFVMAIGLRQRVYRVIGAGETPAHDLRILALLLERLEQERFTTERLRMLHDELDVRGL